MLINEIVLKTHPLRSAHPEAVVHIAPSATPGELHIRLMTYAWRWEDRTILQETTYSIRHTAGQRSAVVDAVAIWIHGEREDKGPSPACNGDELDNIASLLWTTADIHGQDHWPEFRQPKPHPEPKRHG